jgi:thymidylate kinase
MINKICLEGIDGVGKTTVAQKIKERLQVDGISSMVFSPFRATEQRLGISLIEALADSSQAPESLDELLQVIAEQEDQALSEGANVLIFDRHWMSAISVMPNEVLHKVALKFAIPAALLSCDPWLAKERLEARETDINHESINELIRYDQIFKKLAKLSFGNMLGIYRSDADVSIDSLARAIMSDMRYRR